VLAKDVLGRHGEDLAARHLIGAGLSILARNWRCEVGEIDIVARDGNTLVIVEVKTRRSTAFGTPAEAITPRKAETLRSLALAWLQRHPEPAEGLRFDVVSIVVPHRGRTELSHLRGVL
jgi:putative endonuclease